MFFIFKKYVLTIAPYDQAMPARILIRTLYNVYKYLRQDNRAIKEVVATDDLDGIIAREG